MLARHLIHQTQKFLGPTIASRNLSKNSQRPRPDKKHYRLWALPGMLVYHKDILAKQHTMLWHPGLNAGIDELRTIYALRDGILVITEEEFDPDWNFPLVQKAYTNKEGDKLAPTHMRYLNVIPRRRISEYKLIDVV